MGDPSYSFVPQTFEPQTFEPQSVQPPTPAPQAPAGPSMPVPPPVPAAPLLQASLTPAPQGQGGMTWDRAVLPDGQVNASDRAGRTWSFSPRSSVNQDGGDPRFVVVLGVVIAAVGIALGVARPDKPGDGLVLAAFGLLVAGAGVLGVRQRQARATLTAPGSSGHAGAGGPVIPDGPPAYVAGLTDGPMFPRKHFEKALAKPSGVAMRFLHATGYSIAPGDLPADPSVPATVTSRSGVRVPAYPFHVGKAWGYWIGDPTTDPGDGVPVVVNGRTVWALPDGNGRWICHEREVLDGSAHPMAHGAWRVGDGHPRVPDGYHWSQTERVGTDGAANASDWRIVRDGWGGSSGVSWTVGNLPLPSGPRTGPYQPY